MHSRSLSRRAGRGRRPIRVQTGRLRQHATGRSSSPLNLPDVRVGASVVLYRLTPLDASIQIGFGPRGAHFSGLGGASRSDICSALKQHFFAGGYLFDKTEHRSSIYQPRALGHPGLLSPNLPL